MSLPGNRSDDLGTYNNPINKLVWSLSASAREKRAVLFRKYFSVDKETKILDLGSENGTNIFNVLQGTDHDPKNVFIADIERRAVEEGRELYGFTPVIIDEKSPLDFPDGFFDIVYCSSVIEHTTVPKDELWNWKDGNEFRQASLLRQQQFAREIMRLGKEYFVQTPSKTFPIESHTWLPLVGYLPRRMFLPVLKQSNRYWVKKAYPDFNLLGAGDMAKLFPDSTIVKERKFGITKSVMAIRTNGSRG